MKTSLRIDVGSATIPASLVFDNVFAFCLFKLSPRLMTFAMLYINGHVAVEGDWFTAAHFVHGLSDRGRGIIDAVLGLLAQTQKVETYYGWSAEAFARFLDQPYMQYTCGRLQDGNVHVSLEDAQLNKLAFIAEMLAVRPGTRHLDIGCGWGGLLKYLSERHGTISHGVTLALEQARYARIAALGAQVFVTRFEEFVPADLYDVITVVGMLEHLPVSEHATFFERLEQMVRAGGRVYLQCITQSTRVAGDRTRLLNRYVFAHELNTVQNLQACARGAGFRVDYVEEGHEDYAFTIREWVARIRNHEDEIRESLHDDRVYRILLGYLTMGHCLLRVVRAICIGWCSQKNR